MNLMHKINVALDKKYSSKWTPCPHYVLLDIMFEVFKKSGEGLYNCAFVGDTSNPISKLIKLFSGPYSHVVTVWYNENIQSKLSVEEWKRLIKKYAVYYYAMDKSKEVEEYYTEEQIQQIESRLKTIKVLVLASADKNGMNYFDYSKYQTRKQVIIKTTINKIQEDLIVHDYLTKETMNYLYDYTGLAFWWLGHCFDDPEAKYCSEIVYDKFIERNYITACEKDPSPTEIERYGWETNNVIFSRT